ncbi:MAG: hypothetical protein Q8O67_16720 [Deltaproteobacteria bacterium]|nr:hypothetical protein [Deltaproteobacteria bacterium]
MKRFALLLVLVAAAVSCATTTTITTETPGATVVREKDKVELGVTPYKYTTSMWIWESDKLAITSKAGQTKSIEVKRSEFDMLPGLGGIGLSVCLFPIGGPCAGIPIFLAGGMKLPETTKVEFDKKTAGKRPESEPLAYLSPRITPTGTVVY